MMNDEELLKLQSQINAAHNLRMDMLRIEADSRQHMTVGIVEIAVAVVVGAAILVAAVSLAARLIASFLH